MLIQNPRRVPDRQTRQMQSISLSASMNPTLDARERLTERMPAPGMLHRNRLTAPGGSEPAHAMGQPGGPRRTWHCENPGNLTSTRSGVTRTRSNETSAWRRENSSRSCPASARCESGRVDIDKEHRRPKVLAEGIERARHHNVEWASGTPVIMYFLPLIRKSLPS